MKRWLGCLFVGLSVCSLGLVGCGDDSGEEEDGGTAGEATVNEQAAAQSVADSTRALGSFNAGDGAAAASTLYGVAGSASLLILPSGGQQQQAIELPELGEAASAVCEEGCTVEGDAGSCTWTGCAFGGFTLEGSLEWTATSFKSNLVYTIESSGVTATSTLTSDITFSATSIDGTLSLDYEGTASGQTSTVSVDLVYNAVQFPEGGGCPTSGSVDVSGSVSAGGQSYESSASLTFPVAGCQ